jgi:hypothetical protein
MAVIPRKAGSAGARPRGKTVLGRPSVPAARPDAPAPLDAREQLELDALLVRAERVWADWLADEEAALPPEAASGFAARIGEMVEAEREGILADLTSRLRAHAGPGLGELGEKVVTEARDYEDLASRLGDFNIAKRATDDLVAMVAHNGAAHDRLRDQGLAILNSARLSVGGRALLGQHFDAELARALAAVHIDDDPADAHAALTAGKGRQLPLYDALSDEERQRLVVQALAEDARRQSAEHFADRQRLGSLINAGLVDHADIDASELVDRNIDKLTAEHPDSIAAEDAKETRLGHDAGAPGNRAAKYNDGDPELSTANSPFAESTPKRLIDEQSMLKSRSEQEREFLEALVADFRSTGASTAEIREFLTATDRELRLRSRSASIDEVGNDLLMWLLHAVAVGIIVWSESRKRKRKTSGDSSESNDSVKPDVRGGATDSEPPVRETVDDDLSPVELPSDWRSADQDSDGPNEDPERPERKRNLGYFIKFALDDLMRITGRKLSKEQLREIFNELRQQDFRIRIPRDLHQVYRDEHNRLRADIRSEWTRHTGKDWPFETDETGNIIYHDVHHIIPLDLGGPYWAWWNVVPVEGGGAHQRLLHGSQSALRLLYKQLKIK